jgi:ADP-ribosylglycohydrolase
MISDDTEHTVFVAQCLAAHPANPAAFATGMAWKLRWWLLCLPPGIGLATLKACLRLWLGFSADKSGVFSAGNGPAMRSALLGVFFSGKDDEIRAYVRASTRLTHTDPKAETAALAIALTASWTLTEAHRSREIAQIWRSCGPEDPAWQALIDKIVSAEAADRSVSDLAAELGLAKRGVSGYAYHTVPIALYGWLRHAADFRTGLEAVMVCGGDVDTVGAITGALLALNAEIPPEWLAGFTDFPISRQYLEGLALAVESPADHKAPLLFWPILPLRNLILLAIVLVHYLARHLFRIVGFFWRGK